MTVNEPRDVFKFYGWCFLVALKALVVSLLIASIITIL